MILYSNVINIYLIRSENGRSLLLAYRGTSKCTLEETFKCILQLCYTYIFTPLAALYVMDLCI